MPVLTGVERLVTAALAVQLAAATAATQLPSLSDVQPVRAEVAAAPAPPSPSRTSDRPAAPAPSPVAAAPAPAAPRTTTPPPTTTAPPAPRPVATTPVVAPATTAPPAPAAAPAHDPAAYSSALLSGVSQERTARGLPALVHDGCADRYADQQAARMAAQGAMGHQPLEPVLAACGASRVAENVGQGDISAQRMVAAWMASDGHRRNILDPALTAVGTGAARGADGRWYACQVFVAR